MKSALILSLILVGACVVDTDSGSDTDTDITNVPKIALNSLSPVSLYNSNILTSALTPANLQLMAATIDDRAALTYAIGCGLGSAQSVSVTVSGTLYTFNGGMGLATGWTTTALTRPQAQWISSCVYSRLNYYGTAISISIRGSNTGLATTTDELNDYKIEEGAFWGNAFKDIAGGIVGSACEGKDQAHDDTQGDLPNRKCATWDGTSNPQITYCGLTYTGLCSTSCTTNTAPYSICGTSGNTAVATTILLGNPD